jgi:uncharacterized protein (UPF0332 family)
MTEENRTANARAELAIARDAARVARAALDLGIVRDALSRAYYAAFHAARALLLLDGLEPKTHTGLARMFSEHWIKTDRFDRSQMLVLTRLQAYRLASDYAYSFEVQPADARAEVAAAETFVGLATTIVERSALGTQP